jgi:2-keto-4-pentenoate hydratase
MDDAEVEELAGRLRSARREGRTLTALTESRPLSLVDAYRIQSRLVTVRLADGERRIGWKLGYTSRAMRDQMGVDAPNFGPLTDAMLLADGARVPSDALQPRVEPEIAVVLGDRAPELTEQLLAAGPDGVPARLDGAALDLVAAAVVRVHAALEVVDSIWTGYRFRLEDNTADGSSAAWFVLGPQLPRQRLPEIRVELESSSGELTGSGADADGHPLRGVAWLAGQLAARGERFTPGDVVITGGLTRAVPLDAAVQARFTSPGGATVEVSVLPSA